MTNKILVATFLGLGLVACGSEENIGHQLSKLSYEYRDNSAIYTKVTATYGPLVVRETDESGIEAYALRADGKQWLPWSAYWYPTNDTVLFDGADAPLKKYDRFAARTHGSATSAAEFEEKNVYNPAPGWEGSCDAWAKASLFEAEPVRGVGEFTAFDLKALLIKSYQSIDDDSIEYFGERNNGDDSNYKDIYPDQFHRFLQVNLFEDHKPFLMDKDPGIAVWNMPMYYANLTITRDSDPRVLHVQAKVKGANFWTSHTENKRKVLLKEYTYDLMGMPNSDGSFSVDVGQWTGNSIKDHPDFVGAIKHKPVRHRSLNTEIDTKVIEQLMSSSHR